jgi:mono/diheme cytochrome c family protein
MSIKSNRQNFTPRILFPQFLVRVHLCGVLLSLIAILPAQAQQNGAAPQKLNPYTGKAEAIAEGEALYKKFNCYACHGMKGGGGMGPNLTDETWQTGDGSDANVQSQIRDGKGAMPPFKSLLTDDQTWKLIAFVRSLYKGSQEKVRW